MKKKINYTFIYLQVKMLKDVHVEIARLTNVVLKCCCFYFMLAIALKISIRL